MDGFARGIFGKRLRKAETLTELRWHQPLPADGAAAAAVSAAICAQVIPTLVAPEARDFAAAQESAQQFLRAQADDLGSPAYVNTQARRCPGRLRS